VHQVWCANSSLSAHQERSPDLHPPRDVPPRHPPGYRPLTDRLWRVQHAAATLGANR